MKLIDTPPVWLIAFAVIAWLQVRVLPTPFPQPLGHDIGALAILCGAFFMVAAILQLRRHRTTVMPHQSASALVTTGVFGKSRNPIYLADILLLAGFSLWFGSVAGLILVPVFVLVLTQRFIEGEEDRLRASFGNAFEEYSKKTRRWL